MGAFRANGRSFVGVGERGIDPERHVLLRAELGLDRPLPEQYGRLLVATTVILVSLIVDILYGVINPRISRTR